MSDLFSPSAHEHYLKSAKNEILQRSCTHDKSMLTTYLDSNLIPQEKQRLKEKIAECINCSLTLVDMWNEKNDF